MAFCDEELLLDVLLTLLEQQEKIDKKIENSQKNQKRIILMQTILAKRIAKLQQPTKSRSKVVEKPKDDTPIIH